MLYDILDNLTENEKQTKELEKKVKRGIKWGIIVLFVLITIFKSYAIIQSGEVGLKVRYGKIVDTSLKEGFNFKIPYVESIVKVNIKVQKVEMQVMGASKDLQDIITDLAVNYHVSPEYASQLYKRVGNYYEEIVLNPAIQESIKETISQFTAEESIKSRNQLSQNAQDLLQSKMQEYGIIIDSVNFTNLSFSAEYTKAIEEKQVAEQKVQTAKQNLERTKIESEAKLVQAQADAQANELKKRTITKELLQQQFIEKWNGELPKITSGNTIFDISKIIN